MFSSVVQSHVMSPAKPANIESLRVVVVMTIASRIATNLAGFTPDSATLDGFKEQAMRSILHRIGDEVLSLLPRVLSRSRMFKVCLASSLATSA